MARPLTHLGVSAAIAAVQWARTRRLAPAVAPFVTGFLIDADHLTDYARYKLSREKAEGRVILPLHGWEYLLVLALIERLLGGRFAGGLLLGYLGHLLVDQKTNTITHPFTYFLAFRWRRGFPSDLFAHRDEGEVDWMQGSVVDILKHF